MKKNVGTWDALLRITVGLVGISWAISRMARWPYRTNFFTRSVLWLSAMKVAEGITRFCPVLLALGLNSKGLTIRWKKTGPANARTDVSAPSTQPIPTVQHADDPSATPEHGQHHAPAKDTSPKVTDEPTPAPPGRIRPEPIRARQIRQP